MFRLIAAQMMDENVELPMDEYILTMERLDRDAKRHKTLLWGRRTPTQQQTIINRLRNAAMASGLKHSPITFMHGKFAQCRLTFSPITCELPNWHVRKVVVKRGRRVYDRYGRLLYMEKDKIEKRRIPAEHFVAGVEFEERFPMMLNPAEATDAQKEERLAVFYNIYAMTGLQSKAAKAVGVSYWQLIIWTNETEERKAQLLLAGESAKQVMVDMGKERAMKGDTALLKFFIEKDNPERYGVGSRRKEHELPDGVTGDSVQAALSLILKAARDKEAGTHPVGTAITAALVNQTGISSEDGEDTDDVDEHGNVVLETLFEGTEVEEDPEDAQQIAPPKPGSILTLFPSPRVITLNERKGDTARRYLDDIPEDGVQPSILRIEPDGVQAITGSATRARIEDRGEQ